MPHRKSRFTTIVMWAMIPLIVFGSLPRMGCLCANGQHKFFCDRQRSGDVDGRCACCYGRTTAKSAARHETQNPSARGMACCRQSRGGRASDIPVVKSDRPCRPVLDEVVFLTAPKSSLDLDRAQFLSAFANLAFEPQPMAVRAVTADLLRGEPLPPPDRVITLGVMLI